MDFYEKYPELKSFDTIKKYTRRDINNRLLEYWERKDLQSPWVNYTERQRLCEEIERQKAELLRLERLKSL